MKALIIIYFSVCGSFSGSERINDTPFPRDFKFGVGTSAYQIEGAWNEDGKGENIWDHFCHTMPEKITFEEHGDVACNSYHLWRRDVEMLTELGVYHYRFSLSWSRILPTGFVNEINKDGVNYYKSLIKELKRNKIEPIVTLYHWDLPQSLQDLGGWTNDVVVEAFANFTRLCFQLFGEDVQYWITINEPFFACDYGYGSGYFAPGIQSPGIGEYLCAHNLIKSHARAWHIYDDEFRNTQKGKIAMVIHIDWYEPASNTTDDIEAAGRRMEFAVGWYLNPIYYGDYPEVMKERIAKRSKSEGFPESRLPVFTDEEKRYINGTCDFLGINYYVAYLAKNLPEVSAGGPSFENDSGVLSLVPNNFDNSPWAFRKVLKWAKDKYNNPDIYVIENGVATNESFNDDGRIEFIKGHLSSLRDAMMIDKVNVSAYTVWSLMDSFEWVRGYKSKFGLYQTDFNSPERTRSPRRSAEYYKHIIKTRSIVWPERN